VKSGGGKWLCVYQKRKGEERGETFSLITGKMLRSIQFISSNPQVLKSHVVSYFTDLFNRTAETSPAQFISSVHPKIDDTDHEALISPATFHEVKRALFSMKGIKSPGPDGIHAIFYKENWQTVSRSFLNFINSALDSGSVPTTLLEAHMILIPKEQNPDSINKFRPITLLNVAYKVLTKLIVNRSRPLLKDLVGPFQTSFIPGRSTSDNIVLTQEAVNSMSKMRGSKGAMILKLDLHKAFDSIDWSFLREVLHHFNFPQKLISLIMFCISSSRLSIL